MKILLCNDTGTKAHVGCQAVSDAHARMLGRMGHAVHHRFFVRDLARCARPTLAETIGALERHELLMDWLGRSDALVVNGEGTLHHGRGREYLGLLALARRMGKPALLVNSLFQDIDPGSVDRLDAFFVRDRRSLAHARALGVRCDYAPDSILAAGFAAEPDADFRGGTVVTDWQKGRDADIGRACCQYLAVAPEMDRARFFPLHIGSARRNWAGAVASFATAGLVVTARHHGAYMALMAGVPFVALESNSWKINAVVEELDVKFKTAAELLEILAQLDAARSARAAFACAGQRLRASLPLPIFDVLGRGSDSTEEEEVARLHQQIAARPDALRADAAARAKRRLSQAWLRWEALSEFSGPLPATMRLLRMTGLPDRAVAGQ